MTIRCFFKDASTLGCRGDTFAFEITHVLEGICRHSATGIMKDRWDRNDYLEMNRKPLPIAPDDIDLIYLGVQVRQSRLAVAAMAAANRTTVDVQ